MYFLDIIGVHASAPKGFFRPYSTQQENRIDESIQWMHDDETKSASTNDTVNKCQLMIHLAAICLGRPSAIILLTLV